MVLEGQYFEAALQPECGRLQYTLPGQNHRV